MSKKVDDVEVVMEVDGKVVEQPEETKTAKNNKDAKIDKKKKKDKKPRNNKAK